MKHPPVLTVKTWIAKALGKAKTTNAMEMTPQDGEKGR